MSPDGYDRLVQTLEDRAALWPRLYRIQIIVVAAIGYIYITGVILACLVLVLGCVAVVLRFPGALTIKLGLVIGVTAGAVGWQAVRSLWVRITPPEGLPLMRDEYPRLYEAIDDIRRTLGAPPVHGVVLDGTINAAMSQMPRLGIFGWYRNVLVLGLPLLRSLSVDQARSVIAHELGHLSGEHGRVTCWLYRVRASWAAFLTRLQEVGRGSFAVRPFVRWYAPYFSACTFALARSHERQADQIASRVAGRDEAARALLRIAVVGRHAEERFWPTFRRLTAEAPEAPSGYLLPLQRALAEIPSSDGRRWLTEAWLQTTDRIDAHPCLRERVEGIGYPQTPRVLEDGPPGISVPSAAAAWLGTREAVVASALDQVWSRGIADTWAEHHRHVLTQRARQRELAEIRTAGALADQQAWEYACLTAELDGERAAVPLLEDLTARAPAHAEALYLLGCIRLDADDDSGVALLHRAVELDPGATAHVQDRLRLFHDRHGRRDEARRADRELYQRHELERLAAEERTRLPARRQLRPHGLDESSMSTARAVLQRFPEIRRADLARVEVRYLPEQAFYLLAIRIRAPWWKPRASDADAKVLHQMVEAMSLPGAFLAISDSGTTAAMAKATRKRGSVLYQQVS